MFLKKFIMWQSMPQIIKQLKFYVEKLGFEVLRENHRPEKRY